MKNCKTFVPIEGMRIECGYAKTRSGFKHEADLWFNGDKIASAKRCYSNRTWEAYTYESVAKDVLQKAKGLTADQKLAAYNYLDNYKEENPFDALLMVAKIGEVLTDNKTDANKWKQRMMKAGLGEGVSFPDDWDQLSEDEKEKRLNGALDQLK